jgi:hypothetical protein
MLVAVAAVGTTDKTALSVGLVGAALVAKTAILLMLRLEPLTLAAVAEEVVEVFHHLALAQMAALVS